MPPQATTAVRVGHAQRRLVERVPGVHLVTILHQGGHDVVAVRGGGGVQQRLPQLWGAGEGEEREVHRRGSPPHGVPRCRPFIRDSRRGPARLPQAGPRVGKNAGALEKRNTRQDPPRRAASNPPNAPPP